MDKVEAIATVRRYKALLERHFDLEAVYLFGSFATGSDREDSDIDVAVVVNGLSGDYFSVHPLLWTLRREIDDRIEPVLIDKQNDRSGFLGEIERTGIEIV